MAELPQSENVRRRYEISSLLYPGDAAYNIREFISKEDNESLDKSYGDGSSNEICAFKLDRRKIDESANDYRAETCVSTSSESSIQREPRKETVKSDGTFSRNEDESRCKSNRKGKTRRATPEGIIIDLRSDVHEASRGGIKISVISMHDLVSELKFIKVPRKRTRYLMWNSNSKNKITKKIATSRLTLKSSYTKNCNKIKKARKPKRKCKNYSKASTDMSRESTAVNASRNLENILNAGRELHARDNSQSFCTAREVFDSTGWCRHDDVLVNINDARYSILNAEQTCVHARQHIANYCCSIFNSEHQEYHICAREDYHADSSDFNAEMQTDWTTGCFHPEYTRANGCRCFYDSNECNPDINMQRGRCPLMSQTASTTENFALSKEHQRKNVGRLASDQFWMDIATEFTTETNEYSPNGVERHADCDERIESSASTIWKRVPSRASVSAESGGSVVDRRDARHADTPRFEIDAGPGGHRWRTTTVAERVGDRSYKSDLLKGVDTRDVRAWIERRCSNCVVAKPSRTDRNPGEKGESGRGVDSEWKRGSIETDAQQLDYKWERRIATVDAGTRARINFKGKRDSRYKSKEAIRVQLRESAEIRKRKSLEMVEATSQPESDNINDDGKHRNACDSFWTNLQTGKIWSQVHDACKNAVKFVAASIGRVVKDAPKSERSQRNPVEVADVLLVKSSSSRAGKICGETCRKNLMRSKNEKKMEPRQEHIIGNVGKHRENTEASMRKNSRTIAPSRREIQKRAYQKPEKEENEEFRVTYNGTISYDQSILPVALTESSKLET